MNMRKTEELGMPPRVLAQTSARRMSSSWNSKSGLVRRDSGQGEAEIRHSVSPVVSQCLPAAEEISSR